MAGKIISIRATEIATIDTALVTIATYSMMERFIEIAFNTASKVAVEPEVETRDAIRLTVKDELKAQKPEKSIIVGNKIILTDNVFTPELVQILQGGIIHYWSDADRSGEQDTPTEFGISGYTPPPSNSKNKGEPFVLNAYSAQYDSSGQIVQYEKISYPNCTSSPIAFSSEDGVFRMPEYTIMSKAKSDEPPFDIKYLSELPEIEDNTMLVRAA